MKPDRIMRVARPTDRLAAIARMYAKGLAFEVLSQFSDHEGFDGVILEHPHGTYHLEFTSQRDHRMGTAPTKDHLLVFYLPERDERGETCTHEFGLALRRRRWIQGRPPERRLDQITAIYHSPRRRRQ